MDFQTAIKTCLSKYADFNGRAMRSEYWYFVLFLLLTNIAAGIVDAMLFGGGDVQVLSALWSLAMLLPSLAAGARRLHDIDKSGWWLLLTNIAAGIVDALLFGGGDVQVLSALWSLAMLLPSLAAGARRLHDIDKSGWWLLLCLIPILGALVLIYWFIQPSQHGTNRFGPAPRA